jgi:hypothetical protein
VENSQIDEESESYSVYTFSSSSESRSSSSSRSSLSFVNKFAAKRLKSRKIERKIKRAKSFATDAK